MGGKLGGISSRSVIVTKELTPQFGQDILENLRAAICIKQWAINPFLGLHLNGLEVVPLRLDPK